MSTYHERKQARTEAFTKGVKGWKLIKCGACNGSGYYDSSRHGVTPKCGCCNGTGKEKVSPEQYVAYKASEERQLEAQRAHDASIATDPGCLGIMRAGRDYRAGVRTFRTEVHLDDKATVSTIAQVKEYLFYYNEDMRCRGVSVSQEWHDNYDAEHIQPARRA